VEKYLQLDFQVEVVNGENTLRDVERLGALTELRFIGSLAIRRTAACMVSAGAETDSLSQRTGAKVSVPSTNPSVDSV
jgi:hypothetical protein